MDRQDYIRNRLAGYLLDEQGCAVVCPSMDAWQGYSRNGPYRYGWAPPMPIDENELLLIVAFCPELIAATTATLSDDDLDVYLTTIEMFLDRLTAGFGEDPVAIRMAAEAELYSSDPRALELTSRVEATALDQGIVL
jgi:hypothetical protein